MCAASDQPDDRTDQAVAYICRRLDYLRRLLAPDQNMGGDPPELRVLTDAVTAAQRSDQGALQGPLQALHEAVQAAGDPLGVWQVRKERSLHLPGESGEAPFESLYRCPIDRCAGRSPDQSTVFPLTCTITGRELERTIL